MRRSMVVAFAVVALAVALPGAAAGAPAPQDQKGGAATERPSLPKPRVGWHPDSPPDGAGGLGDGSNLLNFKAFRDGDIAIGLGDSITGHAGEWDADYATGSVYANCIWTAQKSVNKVLREDPIVYRTYDRGYGVWVPSLSAAKRAAAPAYCKRQKGEPYVITSLKKDQSRWYCSKLVWASYKYTAGIDLDHNGGLYVWPEDLLNDSQTSLFASSN